MKKTILSTCFMVAGLIVATSVSGVEVPGKASNCIRTTDSQNNTTYTYDCDGASGVCSSTSGSTTTINCNCSEAGALVGSIFSGGEFSTTQEGEIVHVRVTNATPR